MKSKGLTYGLLVVVGIIWYQVFIRVKSNFIEEDLPNNYAAEVQKITKEIHRPNDFDLQANFEDPFRTGKILFKEPKIIESRLISPQEVLPKPKKKIKPTVAWPAIKYFGFVRNTNSKSPRFVLSIDNHVFKLEKGDEVYDNIKVVDATKEELKIKYNGEVKVFQK